jgi:hypothetical protein
MATTPTPRLFPNPNIPAIPPPLANVDALVYVVTALRQGVQSLGGQAGGPYDRAVTLNDLVLLGLITTAQLQDVLRRS